jgi:hypothetical protein
VSTLPVAVDDTGPADQQFRLSANSSMPGLAMQATPTAAQGQNGVWPFRLTATNQQALGNLAFVLLSVTNDVGMVTNLVMRVDTIQFSGVNEPEILGNRGLLWSTSGDSAWFGQSLVTLNGSPVAQSGSIGNNQSSRLRTTVTGPGRLTFWWKVSSEDCGTQCGDFLDFTLGGTTRRIHGEMDWRRVVIPVPSGTRTASWVYTKDANVSMGLDSGWVGEVVYEPGIWLEFAGAPVTNTRSLRVYGVPGRIYSVQVATNSPAAGGPWFSLKPSVLVTNFPMTFVDTNATSAQRFYRLREDTLRFEKPRLIEPGKVVLTLHNSSGRAGEVQWSSDLINWTRLGFIAEGTEMWQQTHSIPEQLPSQFFRAVLYP